MLLCLFLHTLRTVSNHKTQLKSDPTMKRSHLTKAALMLLAITAAAVSCQKSPASEPPAPQDGSVDLSAGGTANCYIVAPESLSSFNAGVKGNSQDQSVGEASGAKLVWQSSKGLVTKLEYDSEQKRISVSTSAAEGNALVAVTDGSGNILWSWHLWITDYSPEETDFTTAPNEAGTTWTFMDRNLGALSVTPGDFSSFGLLYQWGRKDPFPGTVSYTVMNPDYTYEVDGEPVFYDIDGNALPKFGQLAQADGTLEKSILNPTVFYTDSYPSGDWKDVSDDDSWGGESMAKTIYDPCPAGYKVPVSDASGNTPYDWLTYDSITWDGENHGADYNGIWFPATGTRVYASGTLDYNEGTEYGGLWTGTKGKASDDLEQYPDLYAQYMFIIDWNRMFTVSKDSRSQGMSVRCVKE